jgi:neutral ceramidase
MERNAKMVQLNLGRAELAITPPLGVSMAGYYHDRRADDILDDLYARAIVLQAGEMRLAIVVCDLIHLERGFILAVRAAIQEQTGIPSENIMICCTHTHTGPMTNAWPSAGLYADEAYLQVLGRKIADAVRLANQRQQPTTLSVGHGRVEGIAFNRRYWMKDGSVRTNPQFQDTAIVRRAGPEDPDLGVLLFHGEDDKPQALISNYAIHPDQVGGTAICADHEGAEVRVLKQVLGVNCAVLVPNGCCGDINHFDFFQPHAGQCSGPQMAAKNGQVLAGEVIKQLPRMAPVPVSSIHCGQTIVPIDLRVPTSSEIDWAKEMAKKPLGEFDPEGLDVVKAHRMLEVTGMNRSQIEAEVIACSLGDVAIVGLPGEIFVELGLEIKRRSPFKHTLIFELCNDNIGYVLTPKAFDEGGYESSSCIFQPDSGMRLVEAALSLLQIKA